MSFIGRTLAMSQREVIPFTPSTYDDAFPIQFWGDRAVSPETAMTLSIAYACTRVVSEDIAKVPLQIYQSRGDGGKDIARDHEWYETLHSRPNELQTAIEFREMMTAWALNRGRGIAEKTTRRVRMSGGQSVNRRELIPLHPALVHRKMTDDGTVIYEYSDPKTKQVRRLLPDELLIVRGFNNIGVIELPRSFESMLARQGFETNMWRKGPRHAGVIERPKDAPKWNDTNRKVFREAIDEYEQGGDREGRPLLLEDGMTWINSSFSMTDTQFVESGLASAEEGCRWYRVPQHKVQILSRSTNNNIEQQSRDYISDSLQSWAVRWDQAILRDLLESPFFSKHNLDAISQRGNTKERAEAQVTYVNGGIKTQDEIRDQEDLNPMGGDAATLRRAVDAQAQTPPPDAQASEPTSVRRPRAADADAIQRAELMSKVRAFSQDAAGRVWNRERATLGKLAEKTDGKGKEWLDGVDAFYHEYPAFVARAMRCTPEAAESYCRDRRAEVWAGGSASLDDADPTAELIELAIQPSLVLQLVTGAA